MLQSLIGKLNFITNCVRPGRIFLSQLIDDMKNISNNQVKDLDPETKKDIQWWMHFLPKFQGTSIMWLQDCMQVNKFTEEVPCQVNHIVQLEILTILIAIRKWRDVLHSKVVHISSDNQSSIAAINAGRCRDSFMLQCIREIAWVCAEYQILIKMSYIRSADNVLPDLLSR